MGPHYGYHPPGPEEQQKRLVALRRLTSRDIPCILWAEDALDYGHAVPTYLFAQQILVPDDLLDTAATILQESPSRYVPTGPARDYLEMWGPNKGASPWPKSVRLRHLDIAEDEPFALEPLPGSILLLPQSYFDFDVRSTERFQFLSPLLGSSYSKILVPKYHTFIEGAVHCIMNPPTGWVHHKVKMNLDVFLSYLHLYRVKEELEAYQDDVLFPVEEEILEELCTEEARFYMGIYIRERRGVRLAEIAEFKNERRVQTKYVLLPTHASTSNDYDRVTTAPVITNLARGTGSTVISPQLRYRDLS